MSEEVHVDTGRLRMLGAAFEHHAYDLERHLSTFRRRAGSETLRDEIGREGEQPDGFPDGFPGGFADLADQAGKVVEGLRERLDEIADGLKSAARNSETVDQDSAAALRSAR